MQMHCIALAGISPACIDANSSRSWIQIEDLSRSKITAEEEQRSPLFRSLRY